MAPFPSLSALRRHAIGVFALMFLIAAAGGLYHFGIRDAQNSMMPGVCLRVGLVLGATWLAYPQLSRVAERFPPWLIGGFLLGALVVLIRPRAIFAVLPILAAIAFLQFLGWLFRPLPDARRAGRNKAKSRRAD